jgi:hypothetical protein
MLINHDQAHIRRDDSSRKTNPASVGSATLLQIYRCEGCGYGWVKSKISRLPLPLPDFVDATMHLSMARDRDACTEECLVLTRIYRSAGIPALGGGSVFRDRILLCIPKHAHGRCVLLLEGPCYLLSS